MPLHVAAIPDQRAQLNPTARCLADTGQELDNAAFAQEVWRVAARLAEFGIRRGDVVAVMLPNCVELITIMFGAWRLGAAVVLGPQMVNSQR